MPHPPSNLPPPGSRLRYAILHHTGVGEDHYDLVVQLATQELLLTWRLSGLPAADTVATRSADHRAIYLSYEGEISGNRGRVKRVAGGEAEVVGAGLDWLELRFGVAGREIVMRLGL